YPAGSPYSPNGGRHSPFEPFPNRLRQDRVLGEQTSGEGCSANVPRFQTESGAFSFLGTLAHSSRSGIPWATAGGLDAYKIAHHPGFGFGNHSVCRRLSAAQSSDRLDNRRQTEWLPNPN